MCHLILLMPIIGLILFWILPFYAALASYALVDVTSGLIYYSVMRAAHRPRTIGKENIVGQSAEVIQEINPSGQVLLRRRNLGS